jgi:hypothetical protein
VYAKTSKIGNSCIVGQSAEEELQLLALCKPMDHFVLQVQCAWRLALDEPWTPTLVHNIKIDGSICESTSGVRQGQRFHAFVPFHGTSLALEGPVLIDKHGKRNCLAQIARQFNIKCITDIACLQYCCPNAEIATQGLWKDLVWLAQWPLPASWAEDDPGLPGAAWRRQVLAGPLHNWEEERRSIFANGGRELAELAANLKTLGAIDPYAFAADMPGNS